MRQIAIANSLTARFGPAKYRQLRESLRLSRECCLIWMPEIFTGGRAQRNNKGRRPNVYDKVYAAGCFFMIWICQSVGLCAVLRGVGHVSMSEGWGLGRCRFSGEGAHDAEGNVCVGRALTQFRISSMGGEANISVSCHRRNVIRWSSWPGSFLERAKRPIISRACAPRKMRRPVRQPS